MSTLNERITQAEDLADQLQKLIETMLANTRDYDIERILKRSEAEIMDLRHNLTLVKRLKGD